MENTERIENAKYAVQDAVLNLREAREDLDKILKKVAELEAVVESAELELYEAYNTPVE